MIARHRILPLNADDSSRFLPWTIAVMTCLAALALAGAMAMGSATARWKDALAADLTVQIPPLSDEAAEAGRAARPAKGGHDGAAASAAKPASDGGEADDARLAKALELLRGTPGVIAAEALETREVAALLRPWLGSGVAAEALPLPRVIDVAVDPKAGVDARDLAARLAAEVPGATVDEPAEWLDRLASLLRSAELIALLVVALTVSAAALTVVFVTRSGLAVHGTIIELLHLIGAEDSFIARQFEAHALKLGFLGSLPGLALAAASVVFLGAMAARIDAPLLPRLTLTLAQWAVLAILPLIVGAIAMVTARVTVMRRLSQLL
jgi:cell division transport system permease protein